VRAHIDLVTSVRVVRARKAELDAELSRVKDQLADAASDRREREGELKLRDTIETLRQHFPAVRGSLSELCSVNHPKFALAVSVAFGRHLDSVVVNDQKTALDCINYLKEQRLGMITFIPLDTIKVKPISEANRHLREKGFPLAIDCITYDAELEKAFIYALNDTLICDTERSEEDAIKKASKQAEGHKYKIVTLGGTVIHKSGNMTGGASTKYDTKSGKLRSAVEKTASKTIINEREYQKLKKRRDELVEELLKLEAESAAAFRQQDEENKLSSRVSRTPVHKQQHACQ
jgi:structural maintenance of chromosome 1